MITASFIELSALGMYLAVLLAIGRENRVYAVVASMTAGTLATVIWRFVLDSPWQLSPALFGFVVAVAALFIALPLTRQRPLGRLFQPRDSSYHEPVD